MGVSRTIGCLGAICPGKSDGKGGSACAPDWKSTTGEIMIKITLAMNKLCIRENASYHLMACPAIHFAAQPAGRIAPKVLLPEKGLR
jgi:hypothetical protein